MPVNIQEIQEADYLIITPEDKKDIILDQLNDLGLFDPQNNAKLNLVHQFFFEEDKFDIKNYLLCRTSTIRRQLCAISIKIPIQMLDQVAEEENIEASLTESWFSFCVKTAFKKDRAHQFQSFSATESQKIIIDGILGKELDFANLTDNEVIIDHFPLHKRKLIDKMQYSFKKSYQKLKWAFLFGGWEKYMEPVNMIRNYYGESYAFEYAFLIHYQGWLQIPTFFGLILFIYQIVRFFQTGNFVLAVDSPYNSIFGLFVTFWAVLFVESWRQKQKMIQFLWGCEDNSFQSVDERTDQFKFYNVYNPQTDHLIKRATQMPVALKRFYTITVYTTLALVIASMSIYQWLIAQTIIPIDENGNEIGNFSEEEKAQKRNLSIVINTVYSIVILVLGIVYNKIALDETDAENWRYKQQYVDRLVDKLFRFNIFNYYFPMMLVGFDQRNPNRLRDVFNLMLTQMAFKQISSNVVEYYQPILFAKKKLQEHNEEYQELRKLFEDDNLENHELKKLIQSKRSSKASAETPSNSKDDINKEETNFGMYSQ